MQVAVDLRGRVQGWWSGGSVYVVRWMKTEGVGVKADGKDRLLDDFEGRMVFVGEGEEIFEVLHGVS